MAFFISHSFMVKRIYIGWLIWMIGSMLFAQQQKYQIEGTVIDRNTRKPLEFVNVLIAGLGIGSSTDEE